MLTLIQGMGQKMGKEKENITTTKKSRCCSEIYGSPADTIGLILILGILGNFDTGYGTLKIILILGMGQKYL